MIYIYENHMGGCYWTSEPYDYDELYCETCGDSDREIGAASTLDELIDLLSYDGVPIEVMTILLKELSEGSIEIPDDSWQDYPHSVQVAESGHYICDTFNEICNLCYLDGDEPKTWCEECGYNFAAALRDANSKEVLHMTLY